MINFLRSKHSFYYNANSQHFCNIFEIEICVD